MSNFDADTLRMRLERRRELYEQLLNDPNARARQPNGGPPPGTLRSPKAARRWGLAVLAGLASAALWVINRTTTQMVAATGVIAVLSTATTAALLVPARDPASRDTSLNPGEQPAHTATATPVTARPDNHSHTNQWAEPATTPPPAPTQTSSRATPQNRANTTSSSFSTPPSTDAFGPSADNTPASRTPPADTTPTDPPPAEPTTTPPSPTATATLASEPGPGS